MTNNVTDEYPQGIWCLDKKNPKMARKESGEVVIIVPQTPEILEQMKKQIEAAKYFKAFQLVNTEDVNIVGYLNLILNDYVNFLDDENVNKLIAIMKKIEESDHIDTQTATYISQLRTNLKTNNIEIFYDILEQFQAYVQPYNEVANKTH